MWYYNPYSVITHDISKFFHHNSYLYAYPNIAVWFQSVLTPFVSIWLMNVYTGMGIIYKKKRNCRLCNSVINFLILNFKVINHVDVQTGNRIQKKHGVHSQRMQCFSIRIFFYRTNVSMHYIGRLLINSFINF